MFNKEKLSILCILHYFIYQRQRFYNLNFVTIYIFLYFKTVKSNRKGEFKRRINDESVNSNYNLHKVIKRSAGRQLSKM